MRKFKEGDAVIVKHDMAWLGVRGVVVGYRYDSNNDYEWVHVAHNEQDLRERQIDVCYADPNSERWAGWYEDDLERIPGVRLTIRL